MLTPYGPASAFQLLGRVISHFAPSKSVKALKDSVSDIQNVPFIFFCKYDDLYIINKAILYVRQNEQTQRLLVVHVTEDPESSVVKNLSM